MVVDGNFTFAEVSDSLHDELSTEPGDRTDISLFYTVYFWLAQVISSK